MMLETASLLLALILVAYLTDCQATQGGCPSDWHQVKWKCFRFIEPSSGGETFEDAEKICKDIKVTCRGQIVSGSLARIPCAAMQQQLEDLGKELTGDYYIGLTIDGKGRESWVNGDRRGSFEAWANEDDVRPNTRVVMSFSDSNNFGEWKPVDSTTKANYLCMLPCVVGNIEGS